MTKQIYSFEQTIEATKDTRGFWVSNHREIVKPYLARRPVLRRCMRFNLKDGL